MLIYNYDPRTGEYVGSSQARENPREPGSYLVPANATAEVPPTPGTHQKAAWKNGAWTLVPDFRGVTLFKPDGSVAPPLNFGDSPDTTWSTSAPPDTSGDYVLTSGAWARDATKTYARRKAEVDALYATKIAAGFSYSGKVLQMDDASQGDIQAAVLNAQVSNSVPANFAWRTADNSFLPLATVADLVSMATAAFGWVYGLKQAGWGHKDAMKALTADQVAAYDITTGW